MARRRQQQQGEGVVAARNDLAVNVSIHQSRLSYYYFFKVVGDRREWSPHRGAT